ncbi:MAG TPA: hypothetical protein DEO85_08290 [Maritimibacter sp.]|nr:hypothetical protein [Maritimibacter sp.]
MQLWLLLGLTRAPETTTVAGQRYYTVEEGDSLAYISILFYKDTSQYSRIYEATGDTIASPSQIRVVQRLLIPG